MVTLINNGRNRPGPIPTVGTKQPKGGGGGRGGWKQQWGASQKRGTGGKWRKGGGTDGPRIAGFQKKENRKGNLTDQNKGRTGRRQKGAGPVTALNQAQENPGTVTQGQANRPGNTPANKRHTGQTKTSYPEVKKWKAEAQITTGQQNQITLGQIRRSQGRRRLGQNSQRAKSQ